MPHYKDTITLDVDEATIKSLKVGTTVSASIKGKITELEGSREYEMPSCGCDDTSAKKKKTEKIPPRVRVEISSIKVNQPNAFSALIEDDDEED